MGVEKTILEKEDKNRDALSLEKEAEEKASAVETNQKLDAEFESLRKATEIKDQIFTKIESTLNQAMEGKPYLKKHINTEVLFEAIENLFYKLPDDKDKVAVMESTLTILESGKKYSVKEISDKLDEKILDKLSFSDDPVTLNIIRGFIEVIAVYLAVIGGLEGSFGIVIIAIIISSLVGIKVQLNKINVNIDRNKFFDQINEYVPNITKQDFDQLFDNISEIGMTSHDESYLQEKIIALLKDYKENDGVVTQEEISELIRFSKKMKIKSK